VLVVRSEKRKERWGKEWAVTGGTLFIEERQRWGMGDGGCHAAPTRRGGGGDRGGSSQLVAA
jgi:hypothetical protein